MNPGTYIPVCSACCEPLQYEGAYCYRCGILSGPPAPNEQWYGGRSSILFGRPAHHPEPSFHVSEQPHTDSFASSQYPSARWSAGICPPFPRGSTLPPGPQQGFPLDREPYTDVWTSTQYTSAPRSEGWIPSGTPYWSVPQQSLPSNARPYTRPNGWMPYQNPRYNVRRSATAPSPPSRFQRSQGFVRPEEYPRRSPTDYTLRRSGHYAPSRAVIPFTRQPQQDRGMVGPSANNDDAPWDITDSPSRPEPFYRNDHTTPRYKQANAEFNTATSSRQQKEEPQSPTPSSTSPALQGSSRLLAGTTGRGRRRNSGLRRACKAPRSARYGVSKPSADSTIRQPPPGLKDSSRPPTPASCRGRTILSYHDLPSVPEGPEIRKIHLEQA